MGFWGFGGAIHNGFYANVLGSVTYCSPKPQNPVTLNQNITNYYKFSI